MKWSRTFPTWARIAFAVFGFANIFGALLGTRMGRASIDGVVPGIAVGAVFATVGLKGGFPLIPTTGPDAVSVGIRTIRRRQLAIFIVAAVWIPLAMIVVMPKAPANLQTTVFFILAVPLFVAFFVWALSACPRCGRHFLLNKGIPFWALWPRSRCQNCGLGTDGGPTHTA